MSLSKVSSGQEQNNKLERRRQRIRGRSDAPPLDLLSLKPFALASRLYSTPPSSLQDRLRRRLIDHYAQHTADVSLEQHEELASQELRWLEEAARGEGYGSGNWQVRLEGMVREMVEEDKPLAYVLGTQPFHPLPIDLLVRPPTLIPRPETEHWVLHLSQVILESLPSTSSAPKPFRILDIGTGTGCIALGLAHSLLHPSAPSPPTSPFSSVYALAVDKSTSAISLASENATRCNLEQQVTFLETDVFADDFPSVARRGLGGGGGGRGGEQGFDLVVSNPPYITLDEYARLDASVREWEDRGALVGERPGAAPAAVDDGLVFYRRIAGLLGELLVDSSPLLDGASAAPVVAFEVGEGQARAVAALLEERGFKAEIVSDPWGVERAVFGWRNPNGRS